MEWIKEILDNVSTFRTGACDTLNDRIFASEIGRAIDLTDKAYEKYGYLCYCTFTMLVVANCIV